MAEKRIFRQPIDFLQAVDLKSTIKINGTTLAATAAELDAVAAGSGALNPLDRAIKCDVVAISGTALQAANLTLWTAPAASIILRLLLDVTTVATGAATVDIGYTATTATTSSDTLLDGVDVNGAIALFDSMNAALDSGANAKAQKAASAKWITADSASGDTTGMIANAYIFYVLV
jgi:hypothetical protein